ncbi:TetR/AcrR family transcriptional regulator [Actinocorallia sp. A-T 12471]|uniref:TetR/AcrR family transcriptional regulator n=1 Tax=Actinocorallia sp. A-T 12471 TaxID=3089813 RepID=UPI0029D33D2B|nr:TetR/AcrR family transcriptional regulator [Actinocorallia sp. A-T 12471]MDX6739505.1 TetR/AcrR family transcriptional regulator [Actinocorallia sp. A-T 12471]
MTSVRHNTGRADAAPDGPARGGPAPGSTARSAEPKGTASNDAVLDAARDCVLAVGVRRTTLTDIARRAGVSRMTLYRRWPDVRTIVGDLMTREWLALAVSVVDTAASGDARSRLVETLVRGTRAFREHPLLRKIIDVDPELLLPYLLTRTGASQEAFLDLIEDALGEGHRDGSIRPGSAPLQARALLLVVQGFALSLPTMAGDGALSDDAFDAELRLILERTLTP